METSLLRVLVRKGACEESREWAAAYNGDWEKAWNECEHGGWLLWIAAKVGVRKQDIVLAACACARTALVYVPVGEDRPLKAIEAAERWAGGETSIEDVRRAAYAARAAAYAANAAAVGAVADAAVGAAADAAVGAVADAAYAAAYAADAADADAAYAAYAAADAAAAANAAAAADARQAADKQCANLVREKISYAMVLQAYQNS